MFLPSQPSHIRRVSARPRRQTSDSRLRRREGDHRESNGPVGAFLTILMAVLLLGYFFNLAGFGTAASTFFHSLDASAKSQHSTFVTVTTTALPLVGLLITALALYAIVRFAIRIARYSGKHRRLAHRDVITLDHFKTITAERGISLRIATRGYQLLLPFYRSSMRARLNDRLREDLQMSGAQVREVLGILLSQTDRKAKVGGLEEPILTVMDLLMTVQNSAQQSRLKSVVRTGVPSRTASRPAAIVIQQA
jgi:hypothetical protein